MAEPTRKTGRFSGLAGGGEFFVIIQSARQSSPNVSIFLCAIPDSWYNVNRCSILLVPS